MPIKLTLYSDRGSWRWTAAAAVDTDGPSKTPEILKAVLMHGLPQVGGASPSIILTTAILR